MAGRPTDQEKHVLNVQFIGIGNHLKKFSKENRIFPTALRSERGQTMLIVE